MARNLLRLEKREKIKNPRTRGIFIQWQEGIYFAGIRELSPDYSDELVIVTKGESYIPEELLDAIKKQDPRRPELYADDSLDLNGGKFVMRKLGDVLTKPTSEQASFVQNFSSENDATVQ